MKKQLMYVLPVLVLSACGSANAVNTAIKRKATVDESTSQFASFFSSSYKVESNIKNLFTDETFRATDMVSSTAKSNIVYDDSNKIISYTAIVSQNGYAVEQYLDISNTIKTREIGTTKVSFKNNYGSPLKNIMGTASSIKQYFTVGEKAAGFEYTANAEGLAKASSIFGSFFKFYGDSYRWDAKSVQESIENLVVIGNADGTPTSMSFTKVKKDKYGGIKETYSSTLSKIDSVPSIPTVTSSDSEEIKTKLKDSLSLLSSKIAGANFTQTINHPYLEDEVGPYHNYWSFDSDGYGGMLCDIPWYSSQYGETYIGLGYSSYYGYYMEGVSPETDYTGAASNDYHDTYQECLPQIGKLSNEFFKYNSSKDVYVFDLDSFYFDDYYFDFSILDCLFGLVDPCADKFAYYLSDMSNYAMDFHSLSIKINETTALPEFALVYTDSNGIELEVTTSFSDFDTTDLSTNSKLKTAFALLTGEGA